MVSRTAVLVDATGVVLDQKTKLLVYQRMAA